ncbi:MAG: hypothetical protein QOC96_3477 [Acidobacteriota bacterium]|nr:hypothetical protein [Acidobacteriota bacterium]
MPEKSRNEFRDFSQKGANYKPLENLRFAADNIIYSGTEQISVFGKDYLASKFSLIVNVKVQTLCAIGSINTEVYEQVPADFEVFIVDDKDRNIHDTYIREMYGLWNKKELFSGEYFFDFSIKGNNYVLSSMPSLVNVNSFYFVWVNERVVKVVFKGFRDKAKGGWGVMDSFTSDNLRIQIADAEFKAYQYPLRPQKRFIELYKKGFFKSHKSA